MAFVGSITAGGAILGAGALGAGAAIGSSIIGANAAEDAANIQANSAANALGLQKSIFDQNQQNYTTAQANFAPYLGIGKGATYSLGQLYGIGPDGSSTGAQPDYSGFTNSPDYQFAQQQGNLGLDRYENANGLALSGGALKDVSQFNQGLASQQFGNYFNRLMSLSQLGNGAASSSANSASNFANSSNSMANAMGNTIQGQGQAQAAGVVGSANALAGGLNGVANSASGAVNNSLLYNAINRSSYASPNSTPLNPSGQVGGSYYNNGSLVPGPSQSYP